MKPGQGLNIRGDRAMVTALSKGERRGLLAPKIQTEKIGQFLKRKRNPLRAGVVKRRPHEEINPHYVSGMCIANLLYPKNFQKIIATGLTIDYTDSGITYAKRARLTNESQEAIDDSYGHNYVYFAKKYLKYADKIRKKAWELGKKIFEESGIDVNPAEMNIGVSRKGGFIFFEVYGIKISRLKGFVDKMPEGLRKRQALALLGDFTASPADYIYVHDNSHMPVPDKSKMSNITPPSGP